MSLISSEIARCMANLGHKPSPEEDARLRARISELRRHQQHILRHGSYADQLAYEESIADISGMPDGEYKEAM